MIPSYSAGAVAAWLCCPRWYAYRYLEGYAFPQNPSAARHEGERLHRYLAAYFQGRWPQAKPLPDPIRNPLFQNALAYIQALIGEMNWYEWPFYIPRQIGGEKVMLTGRIDYMARQAERMIIVDWKTGDIHENPEYAYQMAFYAWAISQCQDLLGGTISRIETHLVYVEHNHTEVCSYETAQLATLEEQFSTTITQMNPQRFRFLPRPIALKNGTLWCQSCYFKRTCSEGKYHENPHVSV